MISANSFSHSDLKLYELKVRGLEARFFGGISYHSESDLTESSRDDSARIQTNIGDEIHEEEKFLVSANLCRWIIEYDDIQLREQLGMGSYGIVFKGKWKGMDVAVKKFINQRLEERRMLEFRAEMAFLSELQHPNVVVFIGNSSLVHPAII